ncbi:MAG: YfiM family protein [Flavobacteriales bacterium]|nr:YfiM family protein [Flavobacteriales bacterium]
MIRLVAIFILFLNLHVEAQTNFSVDYPDSLNKKRLFSVIASETITYGAGLSFLSFIWYKDQERVPFHLYDDSKGYLQIDKAGHAYGAYRESYAAYYALRWAGLDKRRALIFGGPIGLIFQTPIEIFDGLYEDWGFSWWDMGANTLGSAMFMTQEALFDDQIVLMKFSYAPSIYPDYHRVLGENHIERFFYDYNGHTYWFSANLKKMTKIDKCPKWLNVALGYSANGMIYEFDNPDFYQGQPFPHFERYRQYLLSLDIDMTKLNVKKPWLRKVCRSINLIKIPFPALEYNRVDGFKGHFLYF